jgi:ABC-type antimicrobial peptide transport system permease subunit
VKGADAEAYNVFRLNLIAGRWFENDERPDGFYPAVVTSRFVEKAELTNPVGTIVQMNSQIYKIVGVLSGLKESVFSESPASIIVPVNSWKRIGFYGEYAARIKHGHEDEFYSDYYNELRRSSINFALFEPILSQMSKWKNSTMAGIITEEALIAIPTLFLVLFAIIGTMGLLLLDIKKRIPEFAVRIAVGSSRKKLGQLVLIQNLIISFISAIPGLVLAFFIYEQTLIHWIAILITWTIIILFSILSAWYPAWKVSRVNPAEALQYE